MDAEIGMVAQPRLQVHLLGMFRVTVAGRAVEPEAWRSRRASAIVKLLALAPRGRLLREQIANALWPDFDLDAQLNNLNVATTRARGALGSAGAGKNEFLVRDGDALLLGSEDAIWVDVAAFEQGIAEGWRRRDPALYRAALSLYGGDLLPDDAYEEWASERRTVLRAQYLALLTRLGHLHEERGEFEYAVETFQRVVAAEPTDEAAHARLIRLFARLGQRQQALIQFDQLASALRRHLDTDPAPETRELLKAIRADRDIACLKPVGTLGEQGAEPAPRPPDLSLPLNDLIGRERERAELRAELLRSRIVTLTGPGGIGKTSLALAVAHEASAAFHDGVVFVDLSAVEDADLVVPAISQALETGGQGAQTSLAGLIAVLSTRRSLLVLDNFEQVVEAAPVVAALLERAPRCHLLATSRVPLRIRGETEYRVPPLLVPADEETADEEALLRSPATALFLRRARAVQPNLAADAEHADAIASICRRLDGLPLAIELAAARARVLSPRSMLSRLEQPLALLVDGSRDLPGRQQTMRRAIAWSYDLLSSAEQRLLCRLTVFIGGWTLEAAEAVADGPPPLGISVLDGLASLVEKNLVVQREGEDGEPRFALLETIREFALEQLRGTADELLVDERHAAFAVTFAERAMPHLEGDEPSLWLARLDRESGNLRAALHRLRDRRSAEPALRLVSALTLYWFIRGRLSEGSDACLAVASMPEASAFPARRVDALNSGAFLAREAAAYDRAQAASTEALTEADRLGDRKRQADALANLGYVSLQRGDRARARSQFDACLALNRALGNQQGIADALSFLGMAAQEDGDLDRAWPLNEESLTIWEALADRQAVIWARTRRGGLLLQMDRNAEAEAEFAANLVASKALDFRWGISWSLDGLAHVSAARGERGLAIELLETAALVRQASGMRLRPTEQHDIVRLWERLGATAPSEPETLAPERLAKRLQAVVNHVRSASLRWRAP